MTLSFLVATVAQVVTLAIIARAFLSWFPGVRTLAPVTTLLTEITDPLIRPIQWRLPAFGGIDLAPLVAVLLIGGLSSFALGLLAGH